VRLGRPKRLLLYVISIGVWLTGGLWLLFHHFLVKQGEFGPQNNWLEPWWLKFHGAFGFASIWLFGLLWAVHVTRAWPLARRRWSGGVMVGLMAWLILTGYLLYYIGNDEARSAVSILHWSIGLVAPIVFVWHHRRLRNRRGVRLLRVLLHILLAYRLRLQPHGSSSNEQDDPC
jgi:hypothetical protein